MCVYVCVCICVRVRLVYLNFKTFSGELEFSIIFIALNEHVPKKFD